MRKDRDVDTGEGIRKVVGDLNFEIVQYLLQCGADVNRIDQVSLLKHSFISSSPRPSLAEGRYPPVDRPKEI